MKTSRRVGVGAALLAAAAISVQVVGHAAATLTTPNSLTVNYNLAAGGTSAGITPVTNQAVMLIGSNTTATNFGASSLTLVHLPGVMVRWVGLESPPTATITHGGTAAPGTHVVFLDYSHLVSLEVLSADQLIVHNGSTAAQSGSVKMIW